MRKTKENASRLLLSLFDKSLNEIEVVEVNIKNAAQFLRIGRNALIWITEESTFWIVQSNRPSTARLFISISTEIFSESHEQNKPWIGLKQVFSIRDSQLFRVADSRNDEEVSHNH